MGIYVDRDQSGNVIARYASQQREGQEFLADGSAGLIALQLSDAKAAKLLEIGNALAAKLVAGITFNGVVYQIDDLSQNKVAALGLKAALSIQNVDSVTWPNPFDYIAKDNSRVAFTALQFVSFADACANLVIGYRMHARDLKDAALAATDQTTLAAVDPTAGWPSSTITVS